MFATFLKAAGHGALTIRNCKFNWKCCQSVMLLGYGPSSGRLISNYPLYLQRVPSGRGSIRHRGYSLDRSLLLCNHFPDAVANVMVMIIQRFCALKLAGKWALLPVPGPWTTERVTRGLRNEDSWAESGPS